MQTTLVLTNTQLHELREAANEDVESAAVMTARLVTTVRGNRRLIVQGIRWAPGVSYLRREKKRLEVTSDAFIPPLRAAANAQAIAIWVHTHPRDVAPTSSPSDDIADEELAETFRLRTRSGYYGQLIVSIAGRLTTFTGFLESADGSREPIDRMWSVGDRFELFESHGTITDPTLELYSRNVLAFGPAIQRTLGRLHVGIVGCGGTGSSVIEQLVRLGVRQFTLIDADKLSSSNTTRVYGSFPDQVDQPKVVVQQKHIERIAPDATVAVRDRKVTEEDAARQLDDCDLVFGCTDDNAGRVVLSRLACLMMTPLIDLGVVLDSEQQVIRGIFGRVTIVAPGSACLICRDAIDMRLAESEELTAADRDKRVAEGYAPELPGTAPAVVTFTTLTAAYAVGELLNRLIGLGEGGSPSELMLRPDLHRLNRRGGKPRPGHYCDPNGGKGYAAATTSPFLGKLWTA